MGGTGRPTCPRHVLLPQAEQHAPARHIIEAPPVIRISPKSTDRPASTRMDDVGDEHQRMDLIYHESQTAALCGVSADSERSAHFGRRAAPPLVSTDPPFALSCAGARRQHPAAGQSLQVGLGSRARGCHPASPPHRRPPPPLPAACPQPPPHSLRHRTACSEVELAQIAQELDAAEHALMASGGLESADFLQ